MQNKTFILSMIFVFALVAMPYNAAIANNQPLHPQTHQNLTAMSKKLSDISAQLSTGKMTPQAQKDAAKITQGISHSLQGIAGVGNGIPYKHQAENKKMKQYWNRNPFPAESSMHG